MAAKYRDEIEVGQQLIGLFLLSPLNSPALLDETYHARC